MTDSLNELTNSSRNAYRLKKTTFLNFAILLIFFGFSFLILIYNFDEELKHKPVFNFKYVFISLIVIAFCLIIHFDQSATIQIFSILFLLNIIFVYFFFKFKSFEVHNGHTTKSQVTNGFNLTVKSTTSLVYENYTIPTVLNVIFIETNRERKVFDMRQLCAIESAAFNNPDGNILVYALNASIDTGLLELYKNIKYKKLDVDKVLEDTILNKWWFNDSS
jgi:Ca2+/Na+ antiporter